MDLQKEREAFEAVTNTYHCIYNADLNYYFNGSKLVADKAEIEVNAGWKAWQAAIARMEVRINTLDEMLLNQGEALAEAKAQAVPEKTVQLHLVWNQNKDECVGFLDSKDARYTATGDYRGMFGVTALGDYFRDLNDERDEFETEVVMIEAQEPAK